MQRILCDDCSISFRGTPQQIKDHFSSPKHKKNHEKKLKEKRKEAQNENKHSGLKKTNFIRNKLIEREKQLNSNKEVRLDDPGKMVSKKEFGELFNKKLNETNKVWRRVLDFQQNRVIFENILTGEQTNVLPFGMIESELETNVLMSSEDHLEKNKWSEIQPEDTFNERHKFDATQTVENFLHREIQTEFEVNMMESFEKNGGDVGRAINEQILETKDPVEKFQKLANLAQSNLLFNLEKKRDLSIPTERFERDRNNLMFRKRKIFKKQ